MIYPAAVSVSLNPPLWVKSKDLFVLWLGNFRIEAKLCKDHFCSTQYYVFIDSLNGGRMIYPAAVMYLWVWVILPKGSMTYPYQSRKSLTFLLLLG